MNFKISVVLNSKIMDFHKLFSNYITFKYGNNIY
jgi:hypothetical protein